MTRLLAVPLDVSDVFLMTLLQDSYMEPTRLGSDMYSSEYVFMLSNNGNIVFQLMRLVFSTEQFFVNFRLSPYIPCTFDMTRCIAAALPLCCKFAPPPPPHTHTHTHTQNNILATPVVGVVRLDRPAGLWQP